MMHVNSLETYSQESQKLNRRARDIRAVIERHGPMTARDVRDMLFPGGDMNMVRPRLTELKQSGFIVEMGNADEQGRAVALFRALTQAEYIINKEKEQQGLLF